MNVPRVVIAAPRSGAGKTSISTGLLAALRARGLAVSPHKVGPDYIDPSYHTLAAGRPGRNLDPWLVGEQRIVPLFAHGARGADLAVIEGVMGLFDGAKGHGDFASTAHVARLLAAPVVLVVDASGAGRSLAATVHGFATFDPSVRIAGVVANRVGSDRHAEIVADALAETGVPLLGCVRRRDELWTPSRHLGLVPAAERSSEAARTVDALGAVVAESVDLEAVVRIARSAPGLGADSSPLQQAEPPPANGRSGERAIRVAVAAGEAFTFGYTEQVELLTAAGAEVVPVDPMRDENLPPDTAGLIIGGGFPEVHAVDLSANQPMRQAIRDFGGPIAAECAGLLYLLDTLDGRPMCGVLPGEGEMTPRLTLGYREAVAAADSVIAAEGTRVHGHEFHRTVVRPRAGERAAWLWQPGGAEGFVHGRVHASYLHLHWAGLPGAAERFVAACREARVPA